MKAGSVVWLINNRRGESGGSVENTWDKKLSMYWMPGEREQACS